MLNLILGRQRSGKTYKCLSLAQKMAESGKKTVMLVPEQFSFECQRHLLDTLGPKVSNLIEIHSFTSICEAVSCVYGGLSGHVVDDSTRYILVGQAIKNVKDSLSVYGKYANSQSFLKQMLSVLTEFRQSAVTVDSLNELCEKVESSAFKNKLHDIALILSAYEALLTKRFIDPLDLIDRTLNTMTDNSFFYGKTFIIDEFKGFTEAQFKLLDRMVAGSENVYVSLCCDSVCPNGETDIFTNVKKAADRLIRIAKAHGVAYETELCDYKSVAADALAFESFLANGTAPVFEDEVEHIKICKAKSIYDEVDFVMNTIRRLVREKNMRYRDFVLISRSDGSYSQLIDEISAHYSIPCFTDKRVALSSLPFTVFAVSAVKAALSFDTDDILRLIKTGLVFDDRAEITALENYVYTWSINGKKWLSDWSMSTKGLSGGNSSIDSEKQKAEVERINELRTCVIEPLYSLKKGLCGNAEQMCTALFRYFEKCDVVSRLRILSEQLEKDGYLDEAELQTLGYDAFIKVLDKLVSSADDSEISPRDFSALLSSAVGFETVGDIPRTLDQVIYGTADRIKPMRPKVVFVLGANQDIFPALINDSGLFSQNERAQMIEQSLNIADHGISDCLDEELMFYFAATCATDTTYICYSRTSISGSAMDPAMQIGSIISGFPNAELIEYGSSLDTDCLETEKSTFGKLAEHFSDGDDAVSTLEHYFAEREGYKPRIDSIKRFLSDRAPEITQASALGIYGKEIHLSASKADDFSGCKFMYFCKYGIDARRPDKVDFDPLTRGNIVHYSLEQFVKAHFNDIGSLNNEDIRPETDLYCDRYLEENGAAAYEFDEKFNYMLDVVKDTVASLAAALNNEFSQSEFRPKFCELKVGDDEEVKGVDVLTDSGNRVTLTGYIDRVDMTDDKKVRVVDYKTGSKGDGLKLSELLNGQNMQMLLYLHSLLKNGKEKIGDCIPAGVLYFPAKRDVIGDSEYIRMNGVITDDLETIRQMEPLCEGKIVPAHKRPTSDSFYSTESMISQQAFSMLFKYIELLLMKIGNTLMSGDISPRPLKMGDRLKCEYCDYRSVCRFDPYRDFEVAADCRNRDALDIIRKELEEKENG